MAHNRSDQRSMLGRVEPARGPGLGARPRYFLFGTYSQFRSDSVRMYARSLIRAWCLARKWVKQHPYGRVEVFARRERP